MNTEMVQLIQKYGFDVRFIDSHNVEIFSGYGSVLVDTHDAEYQILNAISHLRAKKPFEFSETDPNCVKRNKERYKKNCRTKRRNDRFRRAREYFFQRNNKCYLCGVELNKTNRTIDHFIPKSKGGSNAIANLRAACRYCNEQKSNRMPSLVAS